MANYDVLESTASYHGTEIRTKVPTDAYRDGWDRIFGKKQNSKANKSRCEVAQDNALNSPEGTQNALEAG